MESRAIQEKSNIVELVSEFAWVQIELNRKGNGPRLMVRDMKTGKSIFLDPLELEALAWARHDELAPLLDPSRRWSNTTNGIG